MTHQVGLVPSAIVQLAWSSIASNSPVMAKLKG